VTDNKDEVYKSKIDSVKPFEFNQDVADVFEDMLSRSIPFYHDIHKIICDLTRYYINSGDLIYDLGCSTGDTIILLSKHLTQLKKEHVSFIGIDNSKAMIGKTRNKFLKNNIKNAKLIDHDLTTFNFESAQMFIMNYTLQFISNNNRLELLTNIRKSLKPKGIFFLSEKIKCNDHNFDNLITDMYYDFKKRNGYSELEISQKREALEEVLIPLSPELQKEELLKAGFSKVEIIFRWYNFASYLCEK